MRDVQNLHTAAWDARALSDDDAVDDHVNALVPALPRSLVPLLMALAYLSAEGQKSSLSGLGPGSRLVLGSLGIVRTDRPELTPLGTAIVNRLLDERSDSESDSPVAAIGLRVGLRQVLRVVSTDVNLAAAFSGNASAAAMATYAIVAAGEDPSDLTGRPIVGVARMGNKLRLWQDADPADSTVDTVLEESSMEALPRRGQRPLVVQNPAGDAPATLLRRILTVGPPVFAADGPLASPATADSVAPPIAAPNNLPNV